MFEKSIFRVEKSIILYAIEYNTLCHIGKSFQINIVIQQTAQINERVEIVSRLMNDVYHCRALIPISDKQ